MELEILTALESIEELIINCTIAICVVTAIFG